MDGKQKKKPLLLRIILGILVFFGILFILLMILPDDEDSDSKDSENDTVLSDDTEHNDHGGDDDGHSSGGEDAKHDIEPVSVGTDAKSATIMIYMNGSDLETKAGEATIDISEMLESGIGDKVNVIIQTMGTKKWQDYGISSKTAQIYKVKDKKLILLEDDLGQLDCTAPETLSRFISYGKTNYPADRYIFLFWDHGGGPVYGFGYDEWQDEEASLTLDEMQKAFSENADIHFDIIGMDCCIMANMETCYVLSPFCKYAVLSEDFESGLGWYYKNWMQHFEDNPGMSTPLLGKKIIDGVINANEDSEEGDSTTMILVNERAVADLKNKWTDYAYANSDKLLNVNYSRLHKAKGKGIITDLIGSWMDDFSNVTMADFYVSDMLSIVESLGAEGEKTDDLRTALKACAAYFGHTSDSNELTGMAVSLPYGDPEYYEQLTKVYTKCGFDADYIKWLGKFVDAEGVGNYHDFSGFEESWGGWASYENGNYCTTGGCSVQGSVQGYEQGNAQCGVQYDGQCSGEDDWTYDYDENVWYLYENDVLYLYDDETDLMCYYDEAGDEYYYYDEGYDGWYPME